MTSSINNNRCKLLVLDLDINKISLTDLRTYFSSYGPVEWIETFPGSTSAIIYFVSYLTVDHLIKQRTGLIGQNNIRLRRFRLDSNNWHIDSHTLHVKFSTSIYTNCILNEENLRFCFRDFQSSMTKLDLIQDNQALISFSNYDYVDQILLVSPNMFSINGIPLVFERMMEKIPRKSRWDQPTDPLTTIPVLSVRDPVVHKLISHIEYLTKQLRGKRIYFDCIRIFILIMIEQPNHTRNELERLEAEVFILKNENAKLKSKQNLLANKNIEQRLAALEDISNRFVNQKEPHHHPNRRERSSSNEKQSKRRRKYRVDDDDYSD